MVKKNTTCNLHLFRKPKIKVEKIQFFYWFSVCLKTKILLLDACVWFYVSEFQTNQWAVAGDEDSLFFPFLFPSYGIDHIFTSNNANSILLSLLSVYKEWKILKYYL